MEQMYFNFNRHELMSDEMRGFILSLITEISRDAWEDEDGFVNQLYGLFDGYYYRSNVEDLKKLKDKISNITFRGLLFVFSEVQKWEEKSISESDVHKINLS